MKQPQRAFADAADYHVERVEAGDGRVVLQFAGALRFRQCFRSWTDVEKMARVPASRVDLDLAGLEHLDGAATALLLELRAELVRAGTASEILGARGPVLAMLQLYGTHAPRPSVREPPKPIGVLDQIGREAMALLGESKGLDFVGDVVVAGLRALRRPRLINWRDVPRLMERAGADGLPIVLMINFLVGLVTAFQAAIQLKQFGANIFVADLVGISITRELAPLMTAIIAAGRSGAAFSAELGTMRISEEIDALRTLGLDPFHFLVFPRVLALALVLPLLTIIRRPDRDRGRAAGSDAEPRPHLQRLFDRDAEGCGALGRCIGRHQGSRVRRHRGAHRVSAWSLDAGWGRGGRAGHDVGRGNRPFCNRRSRCDVHGAVQCVRAGKRHDS